ncbi:MAG: ABC transporter ATP-binding protein [Desulfatiglans sp.]|nr:ABC transporter ATP-binding protein [Desulfatiglans sp.]
MTISNINKRFGALQALKEINFSIDQNMYFGLIGPNGAGKSTLINIMSGLSHATSGFIEIMGYNVRSNWRKARQSLGVVPQELIYDSFFTVREMLRLQSGYFGYGTENYPWIDELIETLDLTDKTHENLHRLSGGMKRRVLIAQALVHKPEVIVLDEPTAGVDVGLRKVLWHFTQKLHKEGSTILLTTHYLEEAESLCQKIAILDKGHLVALDRTRALLEHYPYKLLNLTYKGHTFDIPGSIKSLIVDAREGKLTLKLHRIKDSIGAVLAAIHSCGIHIVDMQTIEPRLEDVFRDFTENNHV